MSEPVKICPECGSNYVMQHNIGGEWGRPWIEYGFYVTYNALHELAPGDYKCGECGREFQVWIDKNDEITIE